MSEMIEQKRKLGVEYKSEIDGLKLTYGTVNLKENKYIYGQFYQPLYISFRNIEQVDYERLMRKFHFELNRILYRVMGNTKKNFGLVQAPEFNTSSTVRKSLIDIEINIENRFGDVKENLVTIKLILGEMRNYIIRKIEKSAISLGR